MAFLLSHRFSGGFLILHCRRWYFFNSQVVRLAWFEMIVCRGFLVNEQR